MKTIQRRMTRQRRVILDELERLGTHPTAEELYRIVRNTLPRISLGTVYRNLELLHGEGRVRRVDGPGRERRWDADMADHHHIHCSRCGRVEDIHDLDTAFLADLACTVPGFEVLGVRLEFEGVCNQCRVRTSKNVS